MKLKELNPVIVELACPCVFHRVQLLQPRADSLPMNGMSMCNCTVTLGVSNPAGAARC